MYISVIRKFYGRRTNTARFGHGTLVTLIHLFLKIHSSTCNPGALRLHLRRPRPTAGDARRLMHQGQRTTALVPQQMRRTHQGSESGDEYRARDSGRRGGRTSGALEGATVRSAMCGGAKNAYQHSTASEGAVESRGRGGDRGAR